MNVSHKESCIAELSALYAADNSVGECLAKIGSEPATPQTWRGRLGAFILRVIGPDRWWQTVELKNFAQAVSRRNEAELRLLESLMAAVRQAETMARREVRRETIVIQSRLDNVEAAQLKLQSLLMDPGPTRDVPLALRKDLARLTNELETLRLQIRSTVESGIREVDEATGDG